MTITAGVFNDIPSALRVPGVYIEFDDRLANSGVWQTRLLVIGQRLGSGEKPALSVERVTGPEQADQYYGRGSMLAEMLRAALAVNPYQETMALALDELDAGVAASGSITVAGSALRAGTLSLYIAGRRVRVGVEATDSAETIAAAIVEAIDNDSRLPVTAVVNGENAHQVDITCRWKGETGNDITLVLNAKDERSLDGEIGRAH